MVTTGFGVTISTRVGPGSRLSGRRLGIDGLPGCGCPHLSRRVQNSPSMRIYLFPSLGLTIFGVLGVCSIERWRANRGSFTFGVSGRCHFLLVHALRASIHNYEPKTHMHF